MHEPVLLVGIEADRSGELRLLSPSIGWWSDLPHAGAYLGPGSSIGRLERLARRFRLILPAGGAGRVVSALPGRRVLPVEFGQLLLRLSPVLEPTAPVGAEEAAALGRPLGADLPPGAYAVVSPTEGVFYRAPAPGAAPFVRVGDRVRAGQPLGLVEVMKTFNQIAYGGPGLPDEAEVVEIRAEDHRDVRAGQVLLVVR